MKRSLEAPESSPSSYAAASIPPEVKTAFAKLYLQFEDDGMDRQYFSEKVCAAGYECSNKSMGRWIDRAREDLPAISPASSRGPEKLLSLDQRMVMIGCILDLNDKKKK